MDLKAEMSGHTAASEGDLRHLGGNSDPLAAELAQVELVGVGQGYDLTRKLATNDKHQLSYLPLP